MSSELKVLQVIPKLGYGGAETGCYDLAHYLPENNCSSYIVTSGGELLKFIDKKKVKLIKQSLVIRVCFLLFVPPGSHFVFDIRFGFLVKHLYTLPAGYV